MAPGRLLDQRGQRWIRYAVCKHSTCNLSAATKGHIIHTHRLHTLCQTHGEECRPVYKKLIAARLRELRQQGPAVQNSYYLHTR